MDRNKAFELLKFLEDNDYLAGSLTAELLIEVLDSENEFETTEITGTWSEPNPEQEKSRLERKQQ